MQANTATKYVTIQEAHETENTVQTIYGKVGIFYTCMRK